MLHLHSKLDYLISMFQRVNKLNIYQWFHEDCLHKVLFLIFAQLAFTQQKLPWHNNCSLIFSYKTLPGFPCQYLSGLLSNSNIFLVYSGHFTNQILY